MRRLLLRRWRPLHTLFRRVFVDNVQLRIVRSTNVRLGLTSLGHFRPHQLVIASAHCVSIDHALNPEVEKRHELQIGIDGKTPGLHAGNRALHNIFSGNS